MTSFSSAIVIERLSPDTTSDRLTSPPPVTVVRFTHWEMTCSMSRVAMAESRITAATVTILRLSISGGVGHTSVIRACSTDVNTSLYKSVKYQI